MRRPTLGIVKSSTSTPRPGPLAAAPPAAGAPPALSACSGAAPSTVAVASTGPEATQPAQAGAACDKPGFGRHAALAVGSVQTYLWKPFSAGAFDAGAKGRTTAMRNGAGASALAARELAAAKPLVA